MMMVPGGQILLEECMKQNLAVVLEADDEIVRDIEDLIRGS